MIYIASDGVPIKSWCADIEDGALQQAKNIAQLPFVFKHVALMPDCHQGYGMPIGGVIAVNNAIIPNAVGVDIGCGMCAVKTTLDHIDTETVKAVFSDIRTSVPLGFAHHDDPQEWDGFDDAPDIPIVLREIESARRQLGTLGGGNHFIELQIGDDGHVWIMLHSGSRNFGFKIAKEYHDKAKKLCELWYSDIPDKDLSFLPIGTIEAREYIKAMNYALAFAAENRRRMIDVCKDALSFHTACTFDDEINIHHNYAATEHHFGKNVWVHRKGATRARKDEYGIIPGSQGATSYIVRGMGNPMSFESCSHGAGRAMGRKEAIRTLDYDAVVAGLDAQGIVHSIRNKDALDEAPQAYKDIDMVIEAQSDLVEVIVSLRPLGVIKG